MKASKTQYLLCPPHNDGSSVNCTSYALQRGNYVTVYLSYHCLKVLIMAIVGKCISLDGNRS